MTEQENAFLKNVALAAQQSERVYGIPASITIAQAILESGWGKTELAIKANNFFGIKAAAHAAPNDYVEFPTDEWVGSGPAAHEERVIAQFARYPSPVESFIAHARLLAMAPRYRAAIEARHNAAQFAAQLQACGYSTSTDPVTGQRNYAAKLMALVREFDLTQYDRQPPVTQSPLEAV